jgi:hypothetical protein
MFDSTVVQVAVGLALLFFVVASVASGVNQVLSRWADARAKTLWTAIAKLLTPSPADPPPPKGAPGPPVPPGSIISGLELTFLRALTFANPRTSHDPRPTALTRTGGPTPETTPAAALLTTPSVRALDPQPKSNKPTKIDALPGKLFASGLLELATIKGSGGELKDQIAQLTTTYAGSPLGAYLGTVAGSYATDVDKFVDGVGNWYDDQMTRLSSVYRQKTRYFLAVIGLVAAFFFNVDAFAVGTALQHDAALRQGAAVVAGGVAAGDITTGCDVAKDAQARTLKCGEEQLNKLEALHVPIIGHWTWDTWSASWTGTTTQVILHLLGLLTTALAVSLGAPFWFDLLKWLTGRRSAPSTT